MKIPSRHLLWPFLILFAVLWLFTEAWTWAAPVASATSQFQQWTLDHALPIPLDGPEVVVYQNTILTLGGKLANGHYTDAIYAAPIQQDGTLGNWTQIGTLPKPLFMHAAVVSGNFLYVIGGFDGQSVLPLVWRARFTDGGELDGSWVSLPNFPTKILMHDAVVVDHAIYVVGGTQNAGPERSDSVYRAMVQEDGSLGAWEIISHIPQARYRHALATDGRTLYVAGGYDGTVRSADLFFAPFEQDGTLGQWQTVSMPDQIAREHLLALIHDGHLVLLGGRSDSTHVLDRVDIATLDNLGRPTAWASGPPLPTPLYRFGGVALNRYGQDYLVILGGRDDQKAYHKEVYHSDLPPTPTPTPTSTPSPTPSPAIALTLHQTPIAQEGDLTRIQYIITARNTSTNPADLLQDVRIQDAIPQNTLLIPESIIPPSGKKVEIGGKSMVEWAIGDFPGGSQLTFSFQVHVPPPTPTPTPTLTPTSTPIPTFTPTATPTPKPSATPTPTSSPIPAPSPTPSSTPTSAPTSTPSPTPTPTPSSANHPPTVNNDTYQVNRGGTLDIPAPGVLANDTDPDGDPLTARNTSNPSHGQLVFRSDGSFTYFHNGDDAIQDMFTYVANDGTTDSDKAATVFINITSPGREKPLRSQYSLPVVLNEGARAIWHFQGQRHTTHTLPLFWPHNYRVWLPMMDHHFPPSR